MQTLLNETLDAAFGTADGLGELALPFEIDLAHQQKERSDEDNEQGQTRFEPEEKSKSTDKLQAGGDESGEIFADECDQHRDVLLQPVEDVTTVEVAQCRPLTLLQLREELVLYAILQAHRQSRSHPLAGQGHQYLQEHQCTQCPKGGVEADDEGASCCHVNGQLCHADKSKATSHLQQSQQKIEGDLWPKSAPMVRCVLCERMQSRERSHFLHQLRWSLPHIIFSRSIKKKSCGCILTIGRV